MGRSFVFAALLAMAAPAMAKAQEWWVIVSFVDHPPFQWTDAVMDRANHLERTLAPCGLGVWWDWTGKFDGFNPNGRGTVFVINTAQRLSKSQAQRILTLARSCQPDAYIKQARYLGE